MSAAWQFTGWLAVGVALLAAMTWLVSAREHRVSRRGRHRPQVWVSLAELMSPARRRRP